MPNQPGRPNPPSVARVEYEERLRDDGMLEIRELRRPPGGGEKVPHVRVVEPRSVQRDLEKLGLIGRDDG